jgi:hypothetical protein
LHFDLPEAQQAGIGAIGGGKQNVGVKEKPIHLPLEVWNLPGPMVRNGIRIKAHLPHRLARLAKIAGSDCVGQKKLGFALGRVTLHGNNDGGTNQDSIVLFFRGNYAAFLNAKALA